MLIRTVFWLSVVVMLMPTGSDHKVEDSNASVANSPISFAMAASVFNDVSTFCERNHEACNAMISFGRTFGKRLQAHTENLGNYLADLEAPAPADPITTSSVSKVQN